MNERRMRGKENRKKDGTRKRGEGGDTRIIKGVSSSSHARRNTCSANLGKLNTVGDACTGEPRQVSLLDHPSRSTVVTWMGEGVNHEGGRQGGVGEREREAGRVDGGRDRTEK